MARYLYLPRLRDEQVLIAAIQEGVASLTWQSETFAYAEGWDEQRQRYQGLRSGQSIRVVVDDRSLLVKPDVAAAQLDAERQPDPSPRTVRSLSLGTDQARFRRPNPPVLEDPQLQRSPHKPRNLDASTVP